MKRMTKYLLLIFVVVAQLCACSSSDDGTAPADNFDVQFTLPPSVDVTKGGECVFAVKDGKAPLISDKFIMESAAGVSLVCPITNVSSESFTVRLASECGVGYYNVFIKRDARKKSAGKIYINIVEELDFEPDPNTTVYGLVSSDGVGVADVVVSDGKEVVVTNSKGIYQFRSAKRWGYVFISVPSGYEVPSVGVLPQFHYTLKSKPDVIERADFTLKKVANQDSYKVLMFGDMHLANRTNDIKQFSDFTADVTAYMAGNKGNKIYALTLGDMTWDLYWYDKNYYFPQYLTTINEKIKDLQIFHTMGNHDNDFKTTSDYDAAVKYVANIAPSYYSFNIGKIHYVVLDDIDCSPYDGSDKRKYIKTLTSEQLEWLAKDLAHVAKSTPVVVATHAQIFYPSGTSDFKIDHDATNTESLLSLLNGYEVHFVTGHTHMSFNVTPEATIIKGQNFYEHNSGSICASWWWSGNLTPGVHIGTDGTPGGYGIWDVSGTSLKWGYKSTGWPENYQFRSYDLNNVSFSMADVPKLSGGNSDVIKDFNKYVTAYPANSANEVLINIWNWSADWTLTVVDQNNKTLTATPVRAYDPLHIAALSVPRFNNSGLTSTPSFVTEEFVHFFKVKADNADVDLTITVKDKFGNTSSETMLRPKAFSTDAYKQK